MRRLLGWTIAVNMLMLALPMGSAAQTPGSLDGLGDVILQLARAVPTPTQQRILDDLFSGRVDATILDADGNNANFAGNDIVAFGLGSISRAGAPLVFTGNRAAFDRWVEDNAETILAILFPASLTESTSGVDVAQSHSQAFLVSTALAAGGRGNIGGRIEFEGFDVERNSGKAVQGLFRVRSFAVEGRFAQLSDTMRTRSTNIGVNLHPAWEGGEPGAQYRVGVDGYFNTLYSTSRALTLGAFDYGGGAWGAGQLDYSQNDGVMSLTFGGMLLGSKTYMPPGLIDDSFEFVSRIVNERPLRWDLTYGGAIQYPVALGWAVGAKVVQSIPVKSPLDEGRRSQLLLLNVAYLLGGDSPLDFGYRFSSGGERFSSQGIFMNANFTF